MLQEPSTAMLCWSPPCLGHSFMPEGLLSPWSPSTG